MSHRTAVAAGNLTKGDRFSFSGADDFETMTVLGTADSTWFPDTKVLVKVDGDRHGVRWLEITKSRSVSLIGSEG